MRVSQAVVDCHCRAAFNAVTRLKEEVLERHSFKVGRMVFGLGVDQLQLMPSIQLHTRISLGAHAHPVQLGRDIMLADCAIGFHSDFKASDMQCINERDINLKKRLATSANDIRLASTRPLCGYGLDQALNRVFLTANEIGVTEFTNSIGPIFFLAAPQIAV
ncbi:hypothetical protein amb3685 [Paramagnetospirillum magneticum AMB-1]|uniref:Uncharacterized protein n=1 Tax=Paramagnetospirillum magneticum (strain ATCC 700264 / AMB-1) TaxID=342108 RepID=Q2W0Y6_PARM1|nr:hypothetical protein amb3685 [Paramagnetospirillum magneticum AMB-1]